MNANLAAYLRFSNEGGMVPGVSNSSKPSKRIHCFPRVTPALSPVPARFEPASRFMRVLLPVFGTPAIINLKVLVCPFESDASRFFSTSFEIAAEIFLREPLSVALSFTTYAPFERSAETSASARPSARSHLLKTYKTGLEPASSFNLGLKEEAGQRASSTNTTPSTSARFPRIIPIAFAICPGYH